jgi:hypothetical protein
MSPMAHLIILRRRRAARSGTSIPSEVMWNRISGALPYAASEGGSDEAQSSSSVATFFGQTVRN